MTLSGLTYGLVAHLRDRHTLSFTPYPDSMTQLHPGGKHLPSLGRAQEEIEDLTSCLHLSGPVSSH